jgi:hypothetical protein
MLLAAFAGATARYAATSDDVASAIDLNCIASLLKLAVGAELPFRTSALRRTPHG